MLGITDTQNYTDIANAIRAKNGSAATYMPSEMAAAISAIPSGGSARLPVEYQEVEWVGSSGTQRIETGIFCNTYGVPLYYETNGISFDSVSTRQLIGAQGAFYVGCVNNKWQVCQGGTNNTGIDISANTWYSFSAFFEGKQYSAKGNFVVKDSSNLQSWQAANIGYTTDNGYQVCLFSLNEQNLPASCKHKDFIIYQNSVLVRHLVPCYRIADSVIGFYDLVNNQFYTNAGTGTFTKGGNV